MVPRRTYVPELNGLQVSWSVVPSAGSSFHDPAYRRHYQYEGLCVRQRTLGLWLHPVMSVRLLLQEGCVKQVGKRLCQFSVIIQLYLLLYYFIIVLGYHVAI